MIRIVASCVLALSLAACSANIGSSPTVSSQFNPKEAMYIFTVGRGEISGQAFVRTADGKVHTAARSQVTLVPATAYARERINAIYRGGGSANQSSRVPSADARYQYFTRKTKANSKGFFSFKDISDGDYYVTTTIVWRSKGTFGSTRRNARAVIRPVSVTGSSKVKVTLSERVS